MFLFYYKNLDLTLDDFTKFQLNNLEYINNMPNYLSIYAKEYQYMRFCCVYFGAMMNEWMRNMFSKQGVGYEETK